MVPDRIVNMTECPLVFAQGRPDETRIQSAGLGGGAGALVGHLIGRRQQAQVEGADVVIPMTSDSDS